MKLDSYVDKVVAERGHPGTTGSPEALRVLLALNQTRQFTEVEDMAVYLGLRPAVVTQACEGLKARGRVVASQAGPGALYALAYVKHFEHISANDVRRLQHASREPA